MIRDPDAPLPSTLNSEPVSLIESVRSRIPRSLWEQLSPIAIESLLRTEYPEKGDFLGCGVIFEELTRTEGLFGATAPRSDKWEKLARDYLNGKVCAVCGGRFRLVAHHMVPFHIDSSKELDLTNLIPLCEGRFSCNCHLTFGHMGNWKLFNPQVIPMSAEYSLRWNLARN